MTPLPEDVAVASLIDSQPFAIVMQGARVERIESLAFSSCCVCVSAEFFLITSQRSPTVVRQREGRARGSEVEEVRRGGAGRRSREGGRGRQESRNVDRNREAELRGESRGSEGGNGDEAKRRGLPEISH